MDDKFTSPVLITKPNIMLWRANMGFRCHRYYHQSAIIFLEIVGTPSAPTLTILQHRVQPSPPATLIHWLHITTFCFSPVSNMLRVTTGTPTQVSCDLLVHTPKSLSPDQTEVKQSTWPGGRAGHTMLDPHLAKYMSPSQFGRNVFNALLLCKAEQFLVN